MPSIRDAVDTITAVREIGSWVNPPTSTRVNQAIVEDQARRDREQHTTSIVESIRQMDSELKSELSRLAEYFAQLPVKNKLFAAAGVALIGANIGALMGVIGLGIVIAESLYLLTGYLLTSHYYSDVARIAFVTEATANAEQQLENTMQNVDAMVNNVRAVSTNFKEIALTVDAHNEQFSEQVIKINEQVAIVRDVTSRLDETRATIIANNTRLRETNQRIDDSWSKVNNGLSNQLNNLEETDTAITQVCNGIQQSNTAINTIQASLGETTQQFKEFLNRLKDASTQRLVVLDEKKQSADKLDAAMSKLDERFVETASIIELAKQTSAMVEETLKSSISTRLINAEAHKIALADNKVTDQAHALATKKNADLNAKLEAIMNKPTRRHPKHQLTFFSASPADEPSNKESPSLTLVR